MPFPWAEDSSHHIVSKGGLTCQKRLPVEQLRRRISEFLECLHLTEIIGHPVVVEEGHEQAFSVLYERHSLRRQIVERLACELVELRGS
jgi:hypothetical protein